MVTEYSFDVSSNVHVPAELTAVCLWAPSGVGTIAKLAVWSEDSVSSFVSWMDVKSEYNKRLSQPGGVVSVLVAACLKKSQYAAPATKDPYHKIWSSKARSFPLAEFQLNFLPIGKC